MLQKMDQFFCGFTFGSMFILIIMSLLHAQSPPSLGNEQKVRTAKVIMSNLHIYKERILID